MYDIEAYLTCHFDVYMLHADKESGAQLQRTEIRTISKY